MTRTRQKVAVTAGLALVAACLGCQGPTPSAGLRAEQAAMPQNQRQAFDDLEEAEFREAVEGLAFRADAVVVTDPLAGTHGEAVAAADDGAGKLEINRRTGALAAYTRAVRIDPDFADAYLGLGTALVTKGKVEYALAAYLTAGRLDTALAEAPFGAAMSLARLGRYDEAVAQMNRAVELDPADAKAHERLAIWYYYLDDTDASWRHVQAVRGLGQEPPGQFMALLEAKTPPRSSSVN